jgi:SAM-dependent methyltransferase
MPIVAAKNWFEMGGAHYAKFRPEYPEELAAFLASFSSAKELAVDVGCGNGQLTLQLARHFERVIGIDSSRDQIANSIIKDRVEYVCAAAEMIPVPDGCASLITASQAAHWFNLPSFYKEVRRIAKDGALIALISYGILRLDEPLDRQFKDFYRNCVSKFWPPERRLVDSGYSDIDFPFEELPAPFMEIRKFWTRDELIGYLSTWSAVRAMNEAGQGKDLKMFESFVANMWGDGGRWVSWPISMRIGSVHK